MITSRTRAFTLAVLLAAFPGTGWAQDATTLLATVARAMGAENLRTLQLSGSGSIYDEKGQHAVLKSYQRTMDLNATTSTVRLVVSSGTPAVERTETLSVTSGSPWNQQYDFWITPFGFLKGAQANASTIETRTLAGESLRVVTFTQGNHRVSGFVNAKDQIARVQLSLEDGTAIEGVYHDYADFGGLKAPTILIRHRAGSLAQVVIVKELKPNA
jgi:hypothetical protein